MVTIKPKVKWRYETGNSVNNIEFLSDDRILISADDELYLVNKKGRVVWKHTSQGFINTVVYDKKNGSVVFDASEEVISLDGKGKNQWELYIGASVDSIYPANGRYLVATHDGVLYSIDKSGDTKWKFDAGSKIAALGFGKDLVLITKNGDICGLDPKKGKEQSHVNTSKEFRIASYVPEENLFVYGTSKRKIGAFSIKGKLLWERKVQYMPTYMKQIGGKIVIGGRDGTVFVSTTEPRILHRFKVGGEVLTSDNFELEGEEYFAVGSGDNTVTIWKNNNLVWKKELEDWINDVGIISKDNVMYIASADMNLYSVSIAAIKKEEPPPPPEPEPEEQEMEFEMVEPEPEEEPEPEMDYEPVELPTRNETEILNQLYSYITKNKKMIFTRSEITNIYFSLKAQNFVILAGRPGLGKTKLAIELANTMREEIYGPEYISEVFIPIHHDFDESDLLGYVNLNDEFMPSALTKTLFFHKNMLKDIDSIQEDEKLCFIILDEMNLSQPDFYMSKLLSAIESGKPIPLPTSKDFKEVIYRPLPKNTYVIGTINSYKEESTRVKLSGGVKRRANIIFVSNPLDRVFALEDVKEQKRKFFRYLTTLLEQVKIDIDEGSLMGSFKKIDFKTVNKKEKLQIFNRLFEVTSIMNHHDESKLTLGILQDILEYMVYSKKIMGLEEAMDFQVLQKIIPQISGDVKIIDELLRLPNFQKEYPKSSEVLKTMRSDAVANMNIIVHQV